MCRRFKLTHYPAAALGIFAVEADEAFRQFLSLAMTKGNNGPPSRALPKTGSA